VLEQATAYSWDAIVFEIARFDGKGWELYDQLRMDLKTQTMPLLLLTSKVMRSDYQKYAQMAIAGVIAKPFDPVALGNEIAHLLGWEASSNLSAIADLCSDCLESQEEWRKFSEIPMLRSK
jgi:CheY-like chemotaxis protein